MFGRGGGRRRWRGNWQSGAGKNRAENRKAAVHFRLRKKREVHGIIHGPAE